MIRNYCNKKHFGEKIVMGIGDLKQKKLLFKIFYVFEKSKREFTASLEYIPIVLTFRCVRRTDRKEAGIQSSECFSANCKPRIKS